MSFLLSVQHLTQSRIFHAVYISRAFFLIDKSPFRPGGAMVARSSPITSHGRETSKPFSSTPAKGAQVKLRLWVRVPPRSRSLFVLQSEFGASTMRVARTSFCAAWVVAVSGKWKRGGVNGGKLVGWSRAGVRLYLRM